MQEAGRAARQKAAERVGRALTVLVDGPGADGRLVARHAGQAPEVDSAVLLPPGAALAGAFVAVRVAGTDGYDLTAEPVKDASP